jgi:hypothetical protein
MALAAKNPAIVAAINARMECAPHVSMESATGMKLELTAAERVQSCAMWAHLALPTTSAQLGAVVSALVAVRSQVPWYSTDPPMALALFCPLLGRAQPAPSMSGLILHPRQVTNLS